MAQYRDYTSQIRISDDSIIINSSFSNGTQMSSTVARDGSMDTNFKAACAAHRDAVLGLSPSSTSPSCYVTTPGKWIKMVPSGTLVTLDAIINVPAGNSGVLVFYLDVTPYTVKYSHNGGSYVTFVNGDTVTVANGDTLKLEAFSVATQDFINGSVSDQDTGKLLDAFSLFNSTPP